MADIQQWRSKVQPARMRTPAIEAKDPEEISSAVSKQRLKSKVSSYFDFSHLSKSASANEDVGSQLPTWPKDQLYPDPNIDDEMDSVICRIMSNPYAQLDVCFNSTLMRIFESHIQLKERKELLQKRVDQEVAFTQSMISKYNMAEKDWEDEKQDYKDEVKRLEVLLSKTSKRGVAEVTLARQDSKLHGMKKNHDKKETVFEFLEKSKRFDDRFYNSQRATMKPAPPLSPSDRDKTISQKLLQKKSMTSVHCDLPFGSPPLTNVKCSLASVSLLEKQDGQRSRRRALTSSTSTSGDTFSAFSCEGELVGDDGAAAIERTKVDDRLHQNGIETKQNANSFAQGSRAESAQTSPQPTYFFRTQETRNFKVVASANSITSNVALARLPSAAARKATENAMAKRQNVRSKANGFLNKFRPQPSPEILVDAGVAPRRFSFEPGDDAAAQSLPMGDITPGVQGRLLRKSVSLDVLSQPVQQRVALERTLSPVAASQSGSAIAGEAPPQSRTLRPAYSTGLLARPPQERENSASSLLTAIKSADNSGKQSNSLSSSVYSSPHVSRDDLARARPHDYEVKSDDTSGSNNDLIHRTNALRDTTSASDAMALKVGGKIADEPVSSWL